MKATLRPTLVWGEGLGDGVEIGLLGSTGAVLSFTMRRAVPMG
jgi:hypothetical protein